MARRSGRFKAADEGGDDMEVEGMLVDDNFPILPSFLPISPFLIVSQMA